MPRRHGRYEFVRPCVQSKRIFADSLMKLSRASLLILALAAAACERDTADPLIECPVWSSCTDALAIEVTLMRGVFTGDNAARFDPGDSVQVRVTVTNRASVPSDSLEIYYGGPAFATWGGKIYPLQLQPGQRVEYVDTLVFATYNFGEPADLEFEVLRYFTSSLVPAKVSGTTNFPVVTSGYRLEVITPPPPLVLFEDDGRTHTGSRLRYSQPNQVGVRVHNPYQAPIRGLTLGICVWENDECFQQFEQLVPDTLHTSQQVDVAFDFNLPPDTYYRWYRERPFYLSLCGEDAFMGRGCQLLPILVGANYEAECDVATITPGVPVTDDVAECGDVNDRGSAFRFTAQAGQRYRAVVISGNGQAFLSAAHGVRELPLPAEIPIPVSGTYYLVVRHTEPVVVRLDQLN
jgi:hypothetical protein